MTTALRRLNLEAIEAADHMNSKHAESHDRDGWYRQTITDLIAEVRAWRMLNPAPPVTVEEVPYPKPCSSCTATYNECTLAIQAREGACCPRCANTATHDQDAWEQINGWKLK